MRKASCSDLSPGACDGPVVVAEIGMGRARRHDQDVVIDRAVERARPASRRRSMAVASASITSTFA